MKYSVDLPEVLDRSSEMAGSSTADFNDMPASRFQAECLVKCGDVKNLCEAYFHPAGNIPKGFFRQKVFDMLYLLHYPDYV
jgi:hypothetical protein